MQPRDIHRWLIGQANCVVIVVSSLLNTNYSSLVMMSYVLVAIYIVYVDIIAKT